MKRALLTFLALALVPVAISFVYYLIFDHHKLDDVFGVMTMSFLLGVPYIAGMLTVGIMRIENVQRLTYRIFAPWIPIMIFFGLTLALAMEGWACWLMVLPIFLIAASIGGLVTGYFRLKDYRTSGKLHVSLVVLLPFLIAPLEHELSGIPAGYEAYTYIDINAKPETIWANVTRVPAIDAEEDKGYLTEFLGFPRPIKAELDYEGIGGQREAIFDRGLIFNEVVTEYEHQKLMRFTIDVDPNDVPATTLDEHVVIGGEFFDVLDGTYRLEDLGNGVHRLHLSSTFEVNTSFNFYSGWWAQMIMSDIQNNILQIIKKRAEQEG